MSSPEEMILFEKIRYQQVTASNTKANCFASDLEEDQMRYIYAILISNDDSSPYRITFNRVDTADAETVFIDSIVVDGDGTLLIGSWNPKCPFFKLQCDENISVQVDTATKTMELTIFYFDEDLNS